VDTYRIDANQLARVEKALTSCAGRPSPLGTAAEVTYYDTYDWRVFRNEGTIEAKGSGAYDIEWRTTEDGSRRWRARRLPSFANDAPSHEVQEALKEVIKARRLLPVVRTEARERAWTLEDQDSRKLAQLVLRDGVARAPWGRNTQRIPPTLRVELLGPRRIATREARRLAEKKLGLTPCTASNLELALEAIGRVPGDYSTRVRVPLDPEMRADAALLAILRTLFEVVRRNEAGIRRRIDPEFLHDFRVSCRRTRAALSQLKGVLPSETVTRFRREFQGLGVASGPARDLDVYVLEIPSYQAELPPDVREDLKPLGRYLERRRDRAYGEFVQVMDGPWYRKTMRDWGRFLASAPLEGGSGRNSCKPIIRVAAKRLRRALARVIHNGKAVTGSSPASDLHALRIDCKKLRYLLEFFSPLYPAEVVEPLAAELKALQNNLGTINDLEIQEQELRRFAVEMEHEGAAEAGTLLAIGQLVERLRQRRRSARAEFGRLFGSFARPGIRKRFEKVIATKPSTKTP
jgi:CHAD domain-containing protein